MLRGGTVAFERTHLPPTSQVDLSAPASPKREPTAAAAADAAAVVDDAACIADVTARLAFSAYFCEGVPQSALEVERVRRVAMFWYPSDGSVSLAEVGARNDGFASFGHYTFKRARVPGLALGDLAVGATVTVGGRAFTVCGADAAARAALEAAGLPRQQPDFEPPFDAFSVRAAADAAAAGAWQGKKSSASTRFVEAAARGQLKPLRREFDGAPPLRFLLHWAPPPEALAGTTTMGKPPPARAQLFHYWLAFDLPSGELEIRAAKGPDGGVRDGGVATLVRRGKLPKALTSLGPTEIGALTAVDAGDLPPPVQWVGEDDLRCGKLRGTVPVGRRQHAAAARMHARARHAYGACTRSSPTLTRARSIASARSISHRPAPRPPLRLPALAALTHARARRHHAERVRPRPDGGGLRRRHAGVVRPAQGHRPARGARGGGAAAAAQARGAPGAAGAARGAAGPQAGRRPR